jgi:uncharacterized protein YceK
MANRFSPGILGAAFLAAVSGCGTLINLSENPNREAGGDKKLYGGVQWDVLVGTGSLLSSLDPSTPTVSARTGAFMAGVCFLADTPLSAVADTLTLPLVVSAFLEKRGLEEGFEKLRAIDAANEAAKGKPRDEEVPLHDRVQGPP